MDQFSAHEWDALAGPQPFLKHAFLHALETSGCVSAQTGWQPHHAGVWRDGRLAAAMPLYLKFHSFGEYVFDWSWAEAFEKAGGRYYPKLLCAIPFTPVPGPRVLGGMAKDQVTLFSHVLEWAGTNGLSSFHCLFPEDSGTAELERAGLLSRQGYQFHWPNPGYRNFEDFLTTLTRDKRKKIRQERRKAHDAGCQFEIRTGRDIRESDWSFFHQCYRNTYHRHRSTPYLNLDFFLRVGETLNQHAAMVLGYHDGNPICSALNFHDGERLYGRYWGALEYAPGLHFETCYYQGMEFCIEQNLKAFEGGAQGEHKLARGFLPVVTRSWHWLADDHFSQVVEDFLLREGRAIEHHVSELEGPYKRGGLS